MSHPGPGRMRKYPVGISCIRSMAVDAIARRGTVAIRSKALVFHHDTNEPLYICMSTVSVDVLDLSERHGTQRRKRSLESQADGCVLMSKRPSRECCRHPICGESLRCTPTACQSARVPRHPHQTKPHRPPPPRASVPRFRVLRQSCIRYLCNARLSLTADAR